MHLLVLRQEALNGENIALSNRLRGIRLKQIVGALHGKLIKIFE